MYKHIQMIIMTGVHTFLFENLKMVGTAPGVSLILLPSDTKHFFSKWTEQILLCGAGVQSFHLKFFNHVFSNLGLFRGNLKRD